MTITANYRSQFILDGIATHYELAFECDDYLVTHTNSNGADTVLVEGTDYTVLDGFLILNETYVAADVITVTKNVPLTQPADYQNGAAFDADDVEGSFDRLTNQVQILQEQIDRSLKLPISTQITDTDVASVAASKYLRINSAGTGIEAVTVTLDGGETLANITGGTGIMVQTSTSNYTARTITGTTSEIEVTNGSGTGGNPVIGLPDHVVIQGTVQVGDGVAGAVGIAASSGFSTSLLSGATSNYSLTLPANAGTNGYVLTTNGAGTLTWTSPTASSASGSNTQIQYNNAGAFGGDSGFTTNGSGTVSIIGQLSVDNLRLNGNDITSINTNGNVNLTPNGTGSFVVTGTQTVAGRVNVDNLRLDGNTLSSTDTNGNINIVPNGTGNVLLGNLTVDADTASPSIGQVLACSSLSGGNQITLTNNAASSTVYGQVQLFDAAVDGSTSTSTSETQVLTPGGVRQLNCVSQGWVRFNGTGTIAQIDTNYNVSSLTDNGTGDYSIDFSDALGTNNEFCVSVTGSATIGYYLSSGSDTNTVHIQMKNDAGTLTDDAQICVIAYGIQ